MPALSAAEIASHLTKVPNWSIENGELVRTFQFKDFLGSMQFVNKVADLAEAAAHHPDIDIRYNKVRLGLVTHDAGGLTAKDFQLAAQADELVQLQPAKELFQTVAQPKMLVGDLQIIMLISLQWSVYCFRRIIDFRTYDGWRMGNMLEKELTYLSANRVELGKLSLASS